MFRGSDAIISATPIAKFLYRTFKFCISGEVRSRDRCLNFHALPVFHTNLTFDLGNIHPVIRNSLIAHLAPRTSSSYFVLLSRTSYLAPRTSHLVPRISSLASRPSPLVSLKRSLCRRQLVSFAFYRHLYGFRECFKDCFNLVMFICSLGFDIEITF
jgi:hypothetical protein